MGSTSVTRRILALGSRDATTGWRDMTFTPETIDALSIPRGGSTTILGVGMYAREDKAFITADPVHLGDQIKTPQGEYYEVVLEEKKYGPTPDNFLFRELQCHELPLWRASPSSQTGPSGMPTDARSNTKTWVDTYANADHTWITLNDGTTAASFATIYENPPYPLELEFRAPSAAVHGLYVIAPNTSEPLLDEGGDVYGYGEVVSVKAYTVDSTDVTGVVLANKMEKELRYVAETYMEGSLRSPSRMQPREIQLGSTVLYETQFDLVYERGTD